jgi:hypothetical protein
MNGKFLTGFNIIVNTYVGGTASFLNGLIGSTTSFLGVGILLCHDKVVLIDSADVKSTQFYSGRLGFMLR